MINLKNTLICRKESSVMKKKKKGFTLIELIVVIAIIGILAMVAVPRLTGFQDRARRTQIVTDARQIATAIDSEIAESAAGTITAVADLAAAQAVAAAHNIVTRSGVDVAHITTLSYQDDGGFTLTETINGTIYTATRAAANDTVTVTP
jgi:type IV pilus assembly protein PilA